MFTRNRLKQLALIFGDFFLLYFSLYLTLIFRYRQLPSAELLGTHLNPFSMIYFIWILIFYSQNLYNLNLAKNNLRFFKTFFESFLINIVLASVFFYFTPYFGIKPKTNLFLNAAIAASLLLLWRSLYNLLAAKHFHKNRIAFLGYSKEARELMNAFLREPQFGYETVCLVNDEIIPDLAAKQMTIEEFLNNAHKLKIDMIVLKHNKLIDERMTDSLYKLIFSKIGFVDLLKFFEEITGKVPTESISHGWFFDNLRESEKKIYDRLKIAMDYFLAAVGGVIFLALLLPISFLTLATSGWPIFYTQTRLGKGEKEFKIRKFRTMIKNAEGGGAQFAAANDGRVTAFGKFLRRTRLDEMPQIINILKGEMSFIGPRPERPEFVAKLTEAAPFYSIRHLVRPGLSGWAQINYPYAGSIEENLEKLQYDIYYIKNRSFILDLAIILKTLNIVLRFRGR